MSMDSLRRRVGVAVVVAVALAASVATAGAASGDPIADKRAEAARVVAQLNALEQKEEVISEAYDNAQIELNSVSAQAKAASAGLARTRHTLAARRKTIAHYAIEAYVQGGSIDDGSSILDSSSGTDISRRQGYTKATQDEAADALNALRAAQAAADSQLVNLRSAQASVAKTEATITKERRAAQAAVAAQQKLSSQVTGQLAVLVRQQQELEAAQAAARARAAQAKFLAEQAAFARLHPALPRPVLQPSAGAPGGDNSGGTDPSSPGGGGSPGQVDVPVGSGAAAAIAAARAEIGVRYTWGGANPSTGFDCSGLVMWAWDHAGVSLPHSSAGQFGVTQHIPLSEVQPGDLIFYGSPIHHVALYIGGGEIIQAPHTGAYVEISSMYDEGDILQTAGRV